MTVAIINYELGNLRSVQNALEFLGGECFVAQEPKELARASHILLPGVGAFGDGMETLNARGWTDEIREQVFEKRKAFFGICLGMQLLAETGLEFGTHKGLGLVGGTVRRLKSDDKSVRIPHIGWNAVNMSAGSKMYEGVPDGQDFYFVHSFVLEPENDGIISGLCEHGEKFVASIEHENIWGAQYHPEKSQGPGLALLKNFMKLD